MKRLAAATHAAMRVQWAVLGPLPLFALFLCCFLVFFFHLHTRSPIAQSVGLGDAAAPGFLEPSPGRPFKFSLLIGILTRPDNYARRHFLRLIYGMQSAPVADIDVKFVFCNLTNEAQRVLVALEILRFDDIIILNCTENMNNGKTYTYLSSLPRILPRGYDYVMKADDDAFVRLGPLAASLWPLPREDLYYGFVIPCASRDPFAGYMSGMGFALSWDLVEWVAASEIPKADVIGPEDKLVGRWFGVGKKARNRYTAKPAMYDYPGANGRCSHELVPETVAVHRLKTWERWMEVLKFFNVTKALKPSKLYHIE